MLSLSEDQSNTEWVDGSAGLLHPCTSARGKHTQRCAQVTLSWVLGCNNTSDFFYVHERFYRQAEHVILSRHLGPQTMQMSKFKPCWLVGHTHSLSLSWLQPRCKPIREQSYYVPSWVIFSSIHNYWGKKRSFLTNGLLDVHADRLANVGTIPTHHKWGTWLMLVTHTLYGDMAITKEILPQSSSTMTYTLLFLKISYMLSACTDTQTQMHAHTQTCTEMTGVSYYSLRGIDKPHSCHLQTYLL